MSATFRWTWPMSTPGSIGAATEPILRLLLDVPFPAFELDHQPPKQRVQLLLLALVQSRPDQVLVSGLRLGRRQPLLLARVRQLDQHPATVVRVREPLYEP